MDIYDKYFEWLCECVGANPYGEYSMLLKHLHEVPFRWSIEMDGNRASDGTDLRLIFASETGSSKLLMVQYDNPCSVLEMLVALAKRVGDNYYSNPFDIFWVAMFNLGLSNYSDTTYNKDSVDDILRRFLDREYDACGVGACAFPNPNPKKDLRFTDIWYQLMWYYSYLE